MEKQRTRLIARLGARFEECRAAYVRGGFDGIGFVFDGEIGPDGLCYCGVDFDACIENGKKSTRSP